MVDINQIPTKRLRMSGASRSDEWNKPEVSHLARDFFKAEEEFGRNQEQWKVQKGRQRHKKINHETAQGSSKNQNNGPHHVRKEVYNSHHGKSSYKKHPVLRTDNRKDFNQPYQKRNLSKTHKEPPHYNERGNVNQEQPESDLPRQNNDEQKSHSRLSYTRLQQMSLKDPTDIIRTLANSRSGLDEFLSGKIKPDFMYLIVKILKKVTESDWEENKMHILIRASTPEFFTKLTEFVTLLVTDEQNTKRKEEMEQFFENLLIFFSSVMIMLPTVAAEHLTRPLRATKMALENVTEYQNVQIGSGLHEKMKQLMFDFEERKQEKQEREEILKLKVEAIYPKPLGNIKNVPVVPRPEDIQNTEGSMIPNKIKGPYKSIEHYLDIQFRLLREDFIAPLRQGINEYRLGSTSNNQKSNKKRKPNNIRIYSKVKFLKPKVMLDKVGYDICIDPDKRLKVRWEYTKRFLYGSLLLFTTDNFHSFFLATVVKRDLGILEKDRVISVMLCDTHEVPKTLLTTEYVMAESEVFFEPYYCVLKALQRFDSNSFPMKKYFVYVDTNTSPPAHTRNGCDTYTISSGEFGRKTVKLFDSCTWPACSELGFDNSQLIAFKAALTNDLVVIQGPPGTGKTYLGLKVAGALLENSAMWNSDRKTPILVICYTNHALDQFLEGILAKKLTDSVVRVGGRSKSELLEPFNLKELRKSISFYANHEQAALLKDIKKEISNIFENIKILQDSLEHLDKNDGILSLRTLQIVMNEQHRRFFKNNDDLLEWLLFGFRNEFSLQKKLISTGDRRMQTSGKEKFLENIERFDIDDFENAIRLKDVLFDGLDLDEPDDIDSNINDQIRVFFSCTLDEIQKRLEETNKLLESLPGSELSRHQIQQKMKEARESERCLRLILKHFEEQLKKSEPASGEEIDRLFSAVDLNSLSCYERWSLYKTWIEFLKAGYWMLISKQEETFRRGARRFDEVRQFDDLKIVQQADVVGVTTTTAARLQAMLRELKPKIVIVEEAAEVLEAHIVASLSVHCQHLILIGDHKQLRPSPADHRVGKDLHLNVSLFERLINNGINFHTLTTQHRMRPEISSLLTPTIYPNLLNHLTTLNRDHIRGMDKDLFFMTHNNFEEEISDIKSKRNHFEARMAMLLARHLLLQGYRPDEITVLTTYSGQMYLLKDEQKRLEISKDLAIVTVDNFQGEENRIVILSLVRSNAENKIGFLKTENRVCVALSRARDGLYVFGNMDCLMAESTLWQRMKQSLVKQQAFGPALILRCETHKNQLTRIMTPDEFNPVKEGGCCKPCGESLPCGHICKSMCHVSKDRHVRYRCSEPCNRFLCKDRHPCSKKCYQECGQCTIPMQRTLNCGHQIMLPCCAEYGKLQCRQMVVVEFPHCQHKVEVDCFRKDHKQCPEPCLSRLECGHACTKTCHVLDDPDHLDYLCPKPCPRPPLNCTSDHKCPHACFEKCEPCQAKVVKQLSCGHSLTTYCASSALLCKVLCNRTMACGHPCKKKCFETCGDCQEMVEKVVPLCGHKVKVACSSAPGVNHCKGECSLKLSCGHKCAKRCKDTCNPDDCQQLVPLLKSLPCGHSGSLFPCSVVSKFNSGSSSDKEQLVQCCSEPCPEMLKCGHRCSGTCGQCMQGRIHKVCEEDCGNTLICGHSCPVPCRKVCPPCEKTCQNRCVHSKCSKKCGEPCIPCQEPCTYRCVHSACTKKCGDLCDRKPCTEPCSQTLPCSHHCVGFCGEPCPPCRKCHPEHFELIFFLGEEEQEDSKWVLLNDCKHVLEATGLEHWLGMDDEGSEIKLKTCPRCRHTEPNRYIATTQRYMNQVKKTFKDIQAVKEKLYGQIEQIRNERKELLRKIRSICAKDMDKFSENDELYFLYHRLVKELPVQSNQRRKEIDIERLQVLAYMTHFLTFLFKRKSEIWEKLNVNTKTVMTSKINVLTRALKQREKKISQPEIESFDLEVNRIVRLGDLLILESSGEFSQLKSKPEVSQCFVEADALVNQLTRYTEEHDKRVFDAIQQLKKALKSNAELTPEERKMINSAMSKSFYGGAAAQGHWFKCPKGHIYAITECGGAMQKARCPVDNCGEIIGGENHRYVSNVRLASEMDGASRPAWSTGNDILNFDLHNLR